MSVKEKQWSHTAQATKTWLIKLERTGKLAASDTKTVFNNLGHILDIEMLRDIYQESDGKKAIGIDGVTKEEYGKDLNKNLNNLLLRIRKGIYKPKASRIVEIPKEDGSKRPLAISCFEDKLVQTTVNKILCTVFEPIFLPCSFGFRPNRDCHGALKALLEHTYRGHTDGAIVEIDVQKYFNTIPHGILMGFLKQKISDIRFLKLMNSLIKAPILENSREKVNEIGCPQGSCISPTLSNIYLHYVIDAWFSEIGRTHMQGKTAEVRYADDMVFIFERKKDAERFYDVLPKRLGRFGLELKLEKTRMITSGKRAAARAEVKGERLEVYQFLGFICYWCKTRKGFWRLKYASRRDRFTSKLKEIREFLKENRNTGNATRFLRVVTQIVRGWINYHGISDNQRRVGRFITRCKHLIFEWFGHRGSKRKMTWDRLSRILKEINFPERWKTRLMF